MPGTDRRLSTSSEEANAPSLSKQLSQDGNEIIPTRMSKVTAPKPASNPLQFIKVGPCDLYKAAQEQIKKVEEIKKVEKVKDDSEDWQSNLDSWKCSRRKRQEHIIERVVEVKKLELEEHDRNRRRSKTFNEMMVERNSKGGARKMSILSFNDEDSNDLSDLGLSSSKDKTGDFYDEDEKNGLDNVNGNNGLNGNGHRRNQEDESSTPATISSPEPEEYTYERAIQGYMNFAEAKIKTPIKNLNESKGTNGNIRISPPKKETGSKIGEKLSELEKIRLRSKSTTDLNGDKELPKVDVNKRRSLFENVEVNETKTKKTDLTVEVSSSIKDRLSNLEKQKTNETKRLSNGDITPISIKERLSSLEKQSDSDVKNRSLNDDLTPPVSIKERVSNLDSSVNKDSTNKVTPERDVSFKEKLKNFKTSEQYHEVFNSNSMNNNVKNNNTNSIIKNNINHINNNTVHNRNNINNICSESENNFHGMNLNEDKVQSIEEINDNSQLVDEIDVNNTTESNKEMLSVSSDDILAESEEPVGVLEPEKVMDEEKDEAVDDKVSVEDSNGDGGKLVTGSVVESPKEESDEVLIASSPSTPESSSTNLPDSVDLSIDTKITFEKTQFHENITITKPKPRTRKLTPMTSPKVALSPTKTVCELQIIEEGDKCQDDGSGDNSQGDDESEEVITVHMSPRKFKSNDVQDNNDEEEEADEGSLYTDENIDEVLADEGEGEARKPTQEDEAITRFDELIEETLKKDVEPDPFSDEAVDDQPKKENDFVEKPRTSLPNYENVIISNQVPHLNMSSGDVEIVASISFPLGPPSSVEPPKEKPPPPPLDLSDDESTPELPPKPSVRRLDSTKRIKKEIRKKRSDFLGIEGSNDDTYLEPEVYVAPPPDMMTFLQEERRLEQQLYRQSICSESDSNHETAESRDSGVELDRGHVDDICWSKPDVLSEPHSRQNSETYGNTSITSEEDEILKKEREIIEVLEKEEQWRYGNKNSTSSEQNDIGEKLAVKLRQLEQEKMQLEWERAEEEGRRQAEETARREDEERLKAKEQQLREQENCACNSNLESTLGQEALRSERERLQKEQEHLDRCRQNLLKQQQQQPTDQLELRRQNNNLHWDAPSTRHSLQEIPVGVSMQDVPRHSMQDVSRPYYPPQINSAYRYSLPDLQDRDPRNSQHPPPPVPPAKPQRPVTQEQWERETNIRNSRIPSADNIPQIEAASKSRHGSSVPAHVNHNGQQMSKSTLHALSAAPRSRIIANENWMYAKRKPDAPKTNYNYQHWLIQEAEHRRICDQQQRISQQIPCRKSLPGHQSSPPKSSNSYPITPPSHHTVGLPISPQNNQKWMSPPRTDKPLPDSIIQTLTQRVQNKTSPRKRLENPIQNKVTSPSTYENHAQLNHSGDTQERMLSVSGKKKCSHCNEELGRGAAMIIESLRLFYHIDCFKCCVCHVQLGDGLMGTDVRVRNNKLHCHNCYSSDDGVKFSCV